MSETILISMGLLVAFEDVSKFASTSVINYLLNQDMSFHLSFSVAKSVLKDAMLWMNVSVLFFFSSERKGVVHPFRDTFSLSIQAPPPFAHSLDTTNILNY